MSERWLPIPGYEGYYEVSDQGAVRSLDRLVPRSKGGTTAIKGRPMKTFPDADGYLSIQIQRDGQKRTFFVHRLVLMAFVGPRPDGFQTRHLDGVRSNNVLANLCYGTPLENAADKRRHATLRAARLGVAS